MRPTHDDFGLGLGRHLLDVFLELLLVLRVDLLSGRQRPLELACAVHSAQRPQRTEGREGAQGGECTVCGA